MSWNYNLTSRTPKNCQKSEFFKKRNSPFFLLILGHFLQKCCKKLCIMMYLGNIHFMFIVPVTFRNFFFIKSFKNGQINKRLNGLDNYPQLSSIFCLINWCKITLRKKSSLTLVQAHAGQGVKLPFYFCQKNAFFEQKMTFFQKVHFLQKCSVTQNTVFQYVKKNFLDPIQS